MLQAVESHIELSLRRTLVRLVRYSTNFVTNPLCSLWKTFFVFFVVNNNNSLKLLSLCFFLSLNISSFSQSNSINQYNVVWTTQSKNSSESMPCGGGDIGTNVWVENGSIYLYVQQSGWFDENNTALKAGRIKIDLSPNPFAGKVFKQELKLQDGYINIEGSDGKLKATVKVWVEISNPIVHIDVESNQKISATAAYETWRYKDRELTGKANNANSWKWAKHVKVIAPKDSIAFLPYGVTFFHRNSDSTIFDYAVRQQGLYSYKDSLMNPLGNLISCGYFLAPHTKPDTVLEGEYLGVSYKSWQLKSVAKFKKYKFYIELNRHQVQPKNEIFTTSFLSSGISPQDSAIKWWHNFWNKSFIHINEDKKDSTWNISKNYALFRYMLGCNAKGSYPTKFNGGLFTFDPSLVDTSIHATPDHRNWGGGTFTAQNQRLVYWPMLKSGDVDLMTPQFDFYNRILKNAELRSKVYWNHNGASFTEQIENFGLPNAAEYGYKRPDSTDKGVEYNKWLEYEWDTALEFCYMILEAEKYYNKNITAYIPLVESCLRFFDEHYQYEAKKRGLSALDENGHLRIYPGSAGETFKLANNPTSTIAALQTVTKALLQSAYLNKENKKYFAELLNRIPPITYRQFDNHVTIAPAKSWARVNNVEPMQLYPVFPWGIFGVGKAGLDTAINTFLYDTLALKFRSHIGWKQDNIWAARLGLTDEAKRLTLLKFQNGKHRFHAFWGPGFDWTPDHNWGGSAMIGLQEMLLQTDDKKIFVLPTWPKDWNVHFKLHAPYNTTVEVNYKNGTIEKLEVLPKEREKDVILPKDF